MADEKTTDDAKQDDGAAKTTTTNAAADAPAPTADNAPVTPQNDQDAPEAPAKAVGDNVWYRLRPYGRWVRATVVDAIGTAKLDEVYEDGMLHLAVKLDRKLDGAAATTGYRLNVPYGAGQGEWLEKKPKDADVVYAREQEQERIRVQLRRQMMGYQDQ